MSKFAVSHISFHDYELEIEFFEAKDEVEALLKSKFFENWADEDLQNIADYDVDQLKEEAFNGDGMIDVQQLPLEQYWESQSK